MSAPSLQKKPYQYMKMSGTEESEIKKHRRRKKVA